MASFSRHQTDKVGVFYILSTQRPKSRSASGEDRADEKPDKIYYIMYRLDGKKVEEKVGRESERMTPAKAAKIREQRVHGVTLPNTERRRIRKEQARPKLITGQSVSCGRHTKRTIPTSRALSPTRTALRTT